MAAAVAAAGQSTRLDWIDFSPIFVTYLHPTVTFLSHLPTFITTEEKNDLLNVITTKSRQEAVGVFLQKLKEKQDQPGIFTAVLQALNNSKQAHIAEMLEIGQKAPKENTRRVKYLIDVFSMVLMQVHPLQMYQYLPCLSTEEQNQIETCTTAHSNERGAMKMFSLLVLKGTTEMFGQLVEALKITGHPKVASDLEELQQNDCDCDDSDCCEEGEEHHMSISYHEGGSADNEAHPPEDDLNDITQARESESDPCHNTEPMSQVCDTPADDKTKKQLQLRNYQMELAGPALPGPNGGKNAIVVAPTGSGKTRVAVKVAMEFLKCEEKHLVNGCSNGSMNLKSRPKKVVFLVNQVTLVEQQSQQFQDFMSTKSVIGLSGDTAHGPLKPVLDEKSVLVMTAQILVNALQEHSVELSDIGLLILDECHNCQKGTPYNRIMSTYRDMKLKNQLRPQVLGLTASLDIGQAKNIYQAEGKILQLCANLDAQLISQVHSPECKKELDAILNVPTEHIVEVAGRTRDRFAEEVDKIMKTIEDVVLSTPGLDKVVESNPQLKTPCNHGSQPYEQWIVQMQDEIAVIIKSTDKAVKRRLIACTEHLKVYNESLYINRDIRTKDAVTKLQTFLEEVTKKKEGFDETDQFLADILQGKMPDLKAIGEDPSSRNPILDKLGDILKQAFRTTDEVKVKRGILFTKTRESVDALIKWISETEGLKALQPGKLIGCGRGRTGGMTQHQQVDVLKLFREGNHKLIVATSVAQEGLDIAQCNVVVKYNCISNVVAHVQAKGRNRAKGGQFFMVLDEQQKLGNQHLTNRIREEMMKKATETIRKKLLTETTVFLRQITEMQKMDQNDRKQRSMNEACRRKQLIKDRIKLICHKCSEFACHSDEIRCIKDAHRIVISDTFTARYDTVPNRKYPKLIDGLDMRMSIVCVKCKAAWGTQAMYKGMIVPLLTIAGFVAEYPSGRQLGRAKKWKDVMFNVEPIAFADLEKVLNTDQSGSCEDDVHEE